MTSEEYAQLIDDYEKGIMVKPGESLTEYIKRMQTTNKAEGGRIGYAGGTDDIPEEEEMSTEEFIDIKKMLGVPSEGIGKIDVGAPSIKMASETPDEEFEMMMGSELEQAFNEFRKMNPGKTYEDFLDEYVRPLMKKMKERRMAMGGGRMMYASGTDTEKQPSDLMDAYKLVDGKKVYIKTEKRRTFDNPFDARKYADDEDRATYRDLQKRTKKATGGLAKLLGV